MFVILHITSHSIYDQLLITSLNWKPVKVDRKSIDNLQMLF